MTNLDHDVIAGAPAPAYTACFCDLVRLMLARMADRPTPEQAGTRTRLMRASYTLDLVCLADRPRRITAELSAPFHQRFLIGRLRTDGTAHLFAPGMQLLVQFLRHESLLQRVTQDLFEAVLACEEVPGAERLC